jgi:hypothetical protein
LHCLEKISDSVESFQCISATIENRNIMLILENVATNLDNIRTVAAVNMTASPSLYNFKADSCQFRQHFRCDILGS